MFLSRPDPPAVAESDLRGMCVSLNSPVLNIEELPVGPARALIVLHDVDGVGMALTIAIRSLESGSLAVFAFEGELRRAESPTAVMDGALAFAEGMGFLFDEDVIEFGGPGGRQRAMCHWHELLGKPVPARAAGAGLAPAAAPPAVAGPGPTASSSAVPLPGLEFDEDILEAAGELAPELALDELFDSAPGVAEAVGVGGESASGPVALDEPLPGPEPEVAGSGPALPLTKFRGPAEAAPQVPTGAAGEVKKKGSVKSASGVSPLGRVSVVKVRMGEDGRAKADFVMRLLRSF